MVDVLFLIGSLQPSSLARQVLALAPALPAVGLQPTVIVLDPPSSWSEPLRSAGVPVEELGLCSVFDAPAFLKLRRLLLDRGESVVHAWGRAAALAARTGGVPSGRLFISGLFRTNDRLGWLERRMMPGSRVVAFSGREADCYRQAGWAAEHILAVRPGLPDPGVVPRRPLPGIPEDVEVLLGLGPLDLRKGFRDAIYAFEMLRYLDERRRLIFLGEGNGREALEVLVEAFATESVSGSDALVRFPGWQADPWPWLGRADLVLAPMHGPGGVYGVLDAMLAGRAVVAAETPDLVEVITHGETGILVPATERMQLARECRFLLQEPERQQALGQAARAVALRTFALEPLVSTLREAYQRSG